MRLGFARGLAFWARSGGQVRRTGSWEHLPPSLEDGEGGMDGKGSEEGGELGLVSNHKEKRI